MRKALAVLSLLVLAALAAFFLVVPREVDRRMNAVALQPPYHASERARALHERLFIADLHDDALLWSRDLLRRHDYGHVDLPRLQEGRVALQVFATVTKSPRGLNFQRNPSDSDTITAPTTKWAARRTACARAASRPSARRWCAASSASACWSTSPMRRRA